MSGSVTATRSTPTLDALSRMTPKEATAVLLAADRGEYEAARGAWVGGPEPDGEEDYTELAEDIYGTADLDKLSDTEYQVLVALLTSPTLASAARAANVSRTTVYRLLSDGEFREALEARRGALRSYVDGLCAERLAGLAIDAMTALEVSVNDYRAGHEAERLRAAEAVLRWRHDLGHAQSVQ